MPQLPPTQRTNQMAPGQQSQPRATHRMTLWLAVLLLTFLPALPAAPARAAPPDDSAPSSSSAAIPLA